SNSSLPLNQISRCCSCPGSPGGPNHRSRSACALSGRLTAGSWFDDITASYRVRPPTASVFAVGTQHLVETSAQRQQVAPSLALALGRAQQKGRMEHRQCRDGIGESWNLEVEPAPAQPSDALAPRQ